jgi:hypothetical protein
MGIWKTSLGGKFFRSLCGLPLLFQRSGMDKVQIRRGFEDNERLRALFPDEEN